LRYPKILSLYNRFDEGPNKGKIIVSDDELKHPVFATIDPWDVYEKIHGMNIRIICDPNPLMILGGHRLPYDKWVTFAGRSDNAQLPANLLPYLYRKFTANTFDAIFPDIAKVILFGEGYGAGIQKGGSYNYDQRFRLFDVLVYDGDANGRGWWLERENIEDVANKFGISTAPYLGRMKREDIVNWVKLGITSDVAIAEGQEHVPGELPIAEGVVCRPIEHMFFRNGDRVMWKIKTKDF